MVPSRLGGFGRAARRDHRSWMRTDVLRMLGKRDYNWALSTDIPTVEDKGMRSMLRGSEGKLERLSQN